MLYCLNPSCHNPVNPPQNRHCQHCGAPIALRNRFIALRPIGQGGFGKTYLAQDQDNRNKLCVVKRFTYVSPDPSSTQKAEQLFEQEAERLDQLLHPQIPRLLAYFQEGDYLYLVQEFIVGKTLQSELNEEGKFSEAKIKAVLQGLLPILKFIHSRKVIHRDLKPDNIMRRQNGELVLIDFGVAKLLEQSTASPGNANNPATTIGTPGYAAPEQIQGRVSPASDLFALGATCFQLLTKAFTSGQVSPVEYDWVQRWQQHTDSDISPKLEHILSRLITVDDQQRYPTAAAVLKDLAPETSAVENTIASLPSNPLSNVATVAVSPAQPVSQRPIPVKTPTPPIKSNPQHLSNQATPPTQSEPQKRSIKSVSVGIGFWLKYGLFTNIGSAVGLSVAVIITFSYLYAVYGSLDGDIPQTLKIFSYLYGALGGLCIGFSQWLIVKKRAGKSIWWIPTTALGFAVSTVVFMNVIVNARESWIAGLLIGAIAGGLQWATVLRHRTPRAHWWILWAAILCTLTFRALTRGPVTPLYIFGWCTITPFLDGLFLSWILRLQYVGNQ